MNTLILSAILGIFMMLSSIAIKNKSLFKHIATVGLLLLLAAAIIEIKGITLFHINIHGMLVFDHFNIYINAIIIAATLLFVLLSGKQIENVGVNVAEYFALIFFILCGCFIAVSFQNLLMLFLGIEIISIPLYILTGSDKRNLKSNEASLKYFLMGAFSTGLMLMGIALIYGATGSFQLNALQAVITGGFSFVEMAGVALLFVSMLFKVSAAPFHFWTPDVYDGAPTVFTSFMATIVKVASFIAFIHLFENKMETFPPSWSTAIAIIIVLTLFIGNITAIFQQSVKRMLAYSSIAQAGFMLFPLLTHNSLAKEGIVLYAVAYSIATIGIFAILMHMKDYTFEGFNGLAKTQPLLAATNTIFLLSLAGIPLTAGFFAKYYMLMSVIKMEQHVWLAIVAVCFAAISVYYYFRVIQAMYFKQNTSGAIITTCIPTPFKIGLLVLAALVILIGVYPQSILYYIYF